jgi:hypothetical protein
MIVLDIETTGLHPAPTPEQADRGITEDYITCIGVMDEFGLSCLSAPIDAFKVSLEGAELTTLKAFKSFIFDIPPEETVFLTYNGVIFDIPFIASRAMHHGLQELAEAVLSAKDIDLQRYVQYATRSEERLNGIRFSKDNACRTLANLYIPKKTEGLWTARIYKNPQLLTLQDHLDMIQHNAVDLAATAKLYNVVKNFPDFSSWRMQEFKDEVQP